MSPSSYLISALVFLIATVVAVPLFTRLRLGSGLAYLVAGAGWGRRVVGVLLFRAVGGVPAMALSPLWAGLGGRMEGQGGGVALRGVRGTGGGGVRRGKSLPRPLSP